jgi:formylglycine-generating enzyme required for sulfatase activity
VSVGATIGHYRLVRALGKGSFGEVFEGVHQHEGQLRVAVKVLHASLAADADFVGALRAECRVLARLKHPHIVGFRDLVVPESGPPALLLDLVEGGSLEAAAARGPSAPALVEAWLREALSALAYAHEEGVIHRDIKPGNLLLDGRGRVQVVDFGIAKAADSGRATKTGTALGTLAYMAPELFDGAAASPQSDLYALGLVGWELLVGRPACAAPTLMGTMKWHAGAGAPRVDAVVGGVPRALADALAAWCAGEVSARPSSAQAALRQLDGVGGAGPTPSGPVVPGTVEVGLPPKGGSGAPPPSAPWPPPAPSGPRPAMPGTVVVSALKPDVGVVCAAPPSLAAKSASRPQPAQSPGASVGVAPQVVKVRGSIERERVVAAGFLGFGRKTSVEDLPFSFSLVRVPAGEFDMGEEPSCRVRLTLGLEVATVPVTQELYYTVMGSNPSGFQRALRPVESVSWFDAIRLCNEISAACGLPSAYRIGDGPEPDVGWDRTSLGFRLPTEAEWEYVARAGQRHEFAGGDFPDDVAWYKKNSGGYPQPVGQKRANRWGLYDMSGNVLEWCWDWYHTRLHKGGASIDPIGPASGSYRVLRGGSWRDYPQFARIAHRSFGAPGNRGDVLGVRLLRTAP